MTCNSEPQGFVLFQGTVLLPAAPDSQWWHSDVGEFGRPSNHVFHSFGTDEHCTSTNICFSFVKLLPEITVKTVCMQMCQTSLSPLSHLFILRSLLVHLF